MRPLNWLPLLLAVASLAACGDSPAGGTDPDTGTDTAVTPDAASDATDDASEDTGEPDVPDTTPDVGEDAEPDVDAPDADEDVAVACAPDQCDIDSKCYDAGDPNPDNPCEVCLVVVDTAEWSYQDGVSCDDDDLCTTDDTCFEGTCMGTILTCADGAACTTSTCNPETGECESAPSEGTCDDGDPCTLNDTCVDGACTAGGDSLHCGSDNPCVAARCEAGVGCVEEFIEGACDDGNACTVGDMCVDGACVAGTEPLDCDDDNLCTLNWCDPEGGCMERSVADLCVDANPCTDEACDPDLGCVFPFNTDPCDDGSVCTAGDTCVEGACRGTAVPLDDLNVCTDDVCADPLGVAHIPNTDPCDDNNVCTVGDVCAEGGCVPGTEPLDCDDDNICTDDTCDAEDGCANTPNTMSCDDGNACTMADVCGDGSCTGAPVDCDDGNECTIDTCDVDTGCAHELIVSNECRPVITVAYPPRAATIQGAADGTVTVTGTVESGAGTIDVFTINGVDVAVGPDGAFTYDMTPSNGGNFLVIEAEDALGSPRRVVQSFAYAQSYVLPDPEAGTGHSAHGLGIYMSDSDQGLNALSGVLGFVIDGFDLGGLSGVLFSDYGHDVTTRGANPIRFGTPEAEFDSTPAGLGLDLTIPDVEIDLRIDGWACDGNVDYDATSLGVDAVVALSVVNNQLAATLVSVDATITGGSVDIDCTLGFIIEAVLGDVSGTIEEEIEDALRDQIADVLADALGAFALEFDLDFPSLDPEGAPVNISLASDFRAVRTDNDGVNMELRTIASSAAVAPYTNLGIPERGGCGELAQRLAFLEDDPLEVLLGDDTVNQLLWGAWHGGLLEFDVPESLLGDLDLSGYGITDLELHASGMLAPIAGDCASGALNAHIGDLRIDAHMNLLGTELDVILFVSLSAGFEIGAADGEITFGISDIDRVELQVEVLDEAFISVESTFEDLILANLVPALLEGLGGDALGGFELPEFDLSEQIDDVPPGTVIRIVPTQVRRSEGNTVVGGTLETE